MSDLSPNFLSIIAKELKLSTKQVETALVLLDGGATVPFLARYRKEATGSLDEVVITTIRDRAAQLHELEKRREAVLCSIEEQGKLTDELKGHIEAASSLSVLEDLYLPYRPKRRTRATIAREKGLEPFAQRLFQQEAFDLESEACVFVDPDKELANVDNVLAGARDIIAEWVSEDARARERIRHLFSRQGILRSKVVRGKENEGAKYKDYFDWAEPLSRIPSHRLLAMRRGEQEDVLSLRIAPPEDDAVARLETLFVTGRNATTEQVRLAIHDGYKRLLAPSMETEIREATKRQADATAIQVFADNLRQLLLAAPLGQKNVLAIDPGFRTGCKAVCVDKQGKFLHTQTIYPHQSAESRKQAGERITGLCQQFQIEAIAIGNGTAGRETEAFVRKLGLPTTLPIVMVDESGASIYSASDVARQEFPDLDVTVRGAISIGRRLMDPLAELVKIDPKSIGVGQYQHDVDQAALKDRLSDVVVSCVNQVGVEVNTASAQLLRSVSGLGPQLAQNIVAYRNENGPFASRVALKKVPRLGPKAFEQAAGFLRIQDSNNILDASAVHPESYPIVQKIARNLHCSVSDLMCDEALRQQIAPNNYVTDQVGLPTLHDILDELAKPGRDPRERFEIVQFAEGVETIGDVKSGMKLAGVVTNVTAFGAFVDIGVHQDGLVHLSQLADRFLKDPNEIVKVQQKVLVTVLDVDLPRKRISLSMKAS